MIFSLYYTLSWGVRHRAPLLSTPHEWVCGCSTDTSANPDADPYAGESSYTLRAGARAYATAGRVPLCLTPPEWVCSNAGYSRGVA